MNRPLRENLEVHADNNGTWIRCTRCLHILCPADQDWKGASKRKLLPPTMAGPLMKNLVGRFFLEQLYCPSCGGLLNTSLVLAEEEKTERRTE